MDTLIYHVELLEQKFPDCCVCCGADDTELEWVDRQDVTFTAGNTYHYSEVLLPFCPAHKKPPVVSLSYPGIRSLTKEGIIVKNVSPEFVDALDHFRNFHPPNRTPSSNIPIVTPSDIRRGEQAYRRFAIRSLIAAILGGVLIAGIVLGLKSLKKDPPQKAPPQRDTTHDLNGPDEFGPPGFPRGSKLHNP
ncbi:MAG: hypothetical protein KDA84_27950 [Planctomycetaceae bacterium]|nr:hypothetical protein [Planctomycetaceae bacterium]